MSDTRTLLHEIAADMDRGRFHLCFRVLAKRHLASQAALLHSIADLTAAQEKWITTARAFRDTAKEPAQ